MSISKLLSPDTAEHRLPDTAMVAVLDDADRVLMVHRHRATLDRSIWELPGGYLDSDDDPSICAAREVERLTGWRPRDMLAVLSFQPALGTLGQRSLVYLARGADLTGRATGKHVGWIPLHELPQRFVAGQIVGAESVSGLLAVLLAKATGRA